MTFKRHDFSYVPGSGALERNHERKTPSSRGRKLDHGRGVVVRRPGMAYQVVDRPGQGAAIRLQHLALPPPDPERLAKLMILPITAFIVPIVNAINAANPHGDVDVQVEYRKAIPGPAITANTI